MIIVEDCRLLVRSDLSIKNRLIGYKIGGKRSKIAQSSVNIQTIPDSEFFLGFLQRFSARVLIENHFRTKDIGFYQAMLSFGNVNRLRSDVDSDRAAITSKHGWHAFSLSKIHLKMNSKKMEFHNIGSCGSLSIIYFRDT